MPDRPPARGSRGMAGGCLIAFSIITGLILGTMMRQPSIGMIAGLGAGIALAILVWLFDRR